MYDFDPSSLQEALKASEAKVNSQSLSPYLFRATRNSLKRVSEWGQLPGLLHHPCLVFAYFVESVVFIFLFTKITASPADCFKEEILIIVFALGFSKLLGTSDFSFCVFPLTLASLCPCPGLG